MAGFRGPSSSYAGVAGADLENAPSGPVPFTSNFGLPVTRVQVWHACGSVPGAQDGVPGNRVAHASGNPDVWTTNVHGVKSPYGGMHAGAVSPGYGGQTAVGGIPQFGSPRPLTQSQESAFRAPGNAPVGYSNDKLVAYDRHGIMKVGYENSGRNSGQTDPPVQGPARPALYLLNRTINYQQGTDTDAATDDLTRDYTRNSTGMYVGEQGTGWSPVSGGTPGLWQEYGSYSGISASTPGYDPVAGTTQGIHSPVGQGQAGDGPHTVWSGPPHGLHSPTLPTYSQTLGRYMSIPQQARPRVDRPSNSPIAGQSYGQTVLPQGQSTANARQIKLGGAPFNSRSRGNGWRGRAAG